MMTNFDFSLVPNISPPPDPLPDIHQQILQQQTIDETHPGTIVQDFQMLLDLVREREIQVSAVNGFFPMKLLAEINTRLSHPIEIDLKRPQQKSYPYIHGLYLLLRASGIAYIDYQGKKAHLIVDKAVLESWHRLNHTERYLTLLEVWLIWATDEILGDYSYAPNIFQCVRFWTTLPDKGLKITKKNQGMLNFNYSPGLHHLALLDLFGMITIQQGKPEPGKGWCITQIQKTPFGEAIIQLSLRAVISELMNGEEETEQNKVSFGKLQPVLQPFFPQWQQKLEIAGHEAIEGIYVFKVLLDNSIWRRIAIPSHLTLEPLVDSILKAFNFDKDHLYQFICKDRFGRTLEIGHPAVDDCPAWTNKFLVEELPLQVGEFMIFWFDFGDDWRFQVLLEAINPPDKKFKKPKMLESHGEAPKQYGYWDDEDEDWEE